MAHLLVDISAHGFGHAGQVLPLVRVLLEEVPALRVTLRSAVPAWKLREHLGRDVPVDVPPPDIGMVMHGPAEVDVAASAAAYADLHRDWDSVVTAEARRLAELQPGLLLADVPYSSLAAAAQVGIPAVALCSLNWGQIYRAYCGGYADAPATLKQIDAAYRSARVFLQTRPHAPMPELDNARSIGPICRQGRTAPQALRDALGVNDATRLALVAFGGIAGRMAVGELPRRPDLVWLRPGGGRGSRDDVVDADVLGWSFCDLAASVDLMVTKAGYGTVCETLAAGTRLLFVERPDWPENTAMRDFALAHGTAAAIAPQTLAAGDFGTILDKLLGQPRGAPVAPSGIAEAQAILQPLLARQAGVLSEGGAL